MSDPTEDQPADEDVMGTAGGPTTVPDATEAEPEPDDASSRRTRPDGVRRAGQG
jgi:hypothetical protein